MARKKNDIFGIIGVGRFGLAVAETLLELGKDVTPDGAASSDYSFIHFKIPYKCSISYIYRKVYKNL